MSGFPYYDCVLYGSAGIIQNIYFLPSREWVSVHINYELKAIYFHARDFLSVLRYVPGLNEKFWKDVHKYCKQCIPNPIL